MTTPTLRRSSSSIPPFREISTPSEIELETRLQSLRARLGDDVRIELHRVDHQSTCGVHYARACDCDNPTPVCIIDGRKWVKIEANGAEQPVDQAAPHPAWLDCEEEPHLLAEVMPVAEWLRVQVCQHVVTTIGEGDTARFIDGEVINSPLTRRLARIEGPTQIIP